MSLPPEVIACGRENARRAGIDEDDGISFAAEAWALHDGAAWRTVTFRRCVDQRRHESGRFGDDHRPVPILDETYADGRPAHDPPDITDPLGDVETRCDLVALVAGLDDTDLGRLARWYWLGVGPGDNTPAAVAHAKAMRHARAQAVAKAIHRQPPAPGCPLSAREREVVGLAADGLGVKQIAARLKLSPNTIKSHLARIARKVGADNTTHAVAIALRAGWIT